MTPEVVASVMGRRVVSKLMVVSNEMGLRFRPGLVDGHWVRDGYLYRDRDLLLVDDGLSLLKEGDGEREREGYREEVLFPVEEQQGTDLLGQHKFLPVAQFKGITGWDKGEDYHQGDGQQREYCCGLHFQSARLQFSC